MSELSTINRIKDAFVVVIVATVIVMGVIRLCL